MSRLICLGQMRIQMRCTELMLFHSRGNVEVLLVLLTMLITIFYSFNASVRSDCNCDDPIASVAFEALGRSSNMVRVRIENKAYEDICFELGHGPRAFRLVRAGRSVPINDDIPFVSLQDRCFVLAPGEFTTEEYEIGRIFPPLRPRDVLCFDALVRIRSRPDSENESVTSCQVVD